MTTEPTPSEADLQQMNALLARGIKLPPQPRVLMEIDRLASEASLNNKAIARLIREDPGLTAALFKVVNSPAMGLSKRVSSIDNAITLLGIKQIINLLKSTALRASIGGDAAVYEKFWDRSTEIARIAAIIAQKRVSVCNIFPDQAYMAALFYECGVPLLMQRFPDYAKSFRLSDAGGWPDLQDEDRIFHTDHAVAGYLVSKAWRLPEFISVAIRYHHDIAHSGLEHRAMVAMLQMSVHLYNRRGRLPDEPEWAAVRPMVLEELGLNEAGEREFEEDILDAVLHGEA